MDDPNFLFGDFLDGGVLFVSRFGIEADEALGLVELVEEGGKIGGGKIGGGDFLEGLGGIVLGEEFDEVQDRSAGGLGEGGFVAGEGDRFFLGSRFFFRREVGVS